MVRGVASPKASTQAIRSPRITAMLTEGTCNACIAAGRSSRAVAGAPGGRSSSSVAISAGALALAAGMATAGRGRGRGCGSPAERCPHSCQRLQMPLVIAGEAQHEVGGAGARIGGKPRRKPVRGAGINRLPLPQHGGGCAVISFEERDPSAPPPGRHRHRPRASGTSPPTAVPGRGLRRGRSRCTSAHCAGERRGVRRIGEPAVEQLARRAPGSPACCRRSRSADRRADAAPAPARRRSPASVRPSPPARRVHSARHSRSPSIMRPTRFSNGTPQAANSARMFGTSRAMPDAQDEASLRHLVQRRHLVRQQHRVAQRRQQHRGAQRDARHPAGHAGEQRQRIVPRPCQHRIADPDRIVAQRLGAGGERQQRTRPPAGPP